METTITSKNLGHLGLVAGMIDELAIVATIDSAIVQETRDRHITVGQAIKAMIINGLGFSQRTLYMTSTFFENLPVDVLLGPEISSNHLNDTVLGRALDAIYDYGCTKLYREVSVEMCKQLNLSPTVVCMDSTSFHLDGKYNSENPPEEDSNTIHITRGCSRDHRPDPCQVILNLIIENKAGIALNMEAHSGNKVDKTIFRETIENHVSQLQCQYEMSTLLMDSAGYTLQTIQEHSDQILWISRVPENIAEARRAIASKEAMSPLSEGYTYRVMSSSYGGVKQRWAVIFSEAAYQKQIVTLKKKYDKEVEKSLHSFNKLTKVAYSCEEDAKKALDKFKKSNLAIEISDTKIKSIPQYKKKGRPANDAEPSHYHYFIQGVAKASTKRFEEQSASKGRFIIATNNMDAGKLPDDQILDEFKKLAKIERGFRFIKDPQFAASTFFVKKPERIEALLFVMTLCLSVYAAIEYRVRSQLNKENQTLPNQVNKQVKNPTARWLFILMAGIHVLYQGDAKPIILNLNDTKNKIIDLLGEPTKKYYFRI